MAVNLVDLSLMEVAAREEVARVKRMQRAWSAYLGEYDRPLKIKMGQPDDNVIVNKAKVIIDKGVSFLFGRPVTFDLAADASQNELPAEVWLNRVWAYNRQATLLTKLAMNGGVCGHTFLRVVLPAQPGAFPRLVVLDPSTVTVRWDGDDLDLVTYYKVQYPAIDPKTGRPVAIRQLIERGDNGRWTITDQRSRQAINYGIVPGDWTTISTVVWPYDWPPLIDCQNLPLPNQYWGCSDIEDDVLGLVRARNFNLSNWSRINKYHAHPRTWGSGFSADDLETSVDSTVILPSADARLQNLEMHGDQASVNELDRRIDEGLHEVTRIPAIATGKLESIGNLSGVALRVLYAPLLEKTETKRGTYGNLLTELNRRLLEIGGYGPDNEVSTHWSELLPTDMLAEAQTAQLWSALGVSEDTILSRLGFDSQHERDQRAQEGGFVEPNDGTMGQTDQQGNG